MPLFTAKCDDSVWMVGKPVATDLLVKAPLSWLSVVTDFRPLKCMTTVLSRPKYRLPAICR